MVGESETGRNKVHRYYKCASVKNHKGCDKKTVKKERLESLEKQKSELSVQIIKEEMAKPTLSREQIIFWFHRFRKLNTKRLDHRRRLIDSFVNDGFLYDDSITFTFN